MYKRDQKSQVREEASFFWVHRNFHSHSLKCFIQSNFGSQETEKGKKRLNLRSKMYRLKITGRLLVNFAQNKKDFYYLPVQWDKKIWKEDMSLESNFFCWGLHKILLFLLCPQHSCWLIVQIGRVQTLGALKDVSSCIWVFLREGITWKFLSRPGFCHLALSELFFLLLFLSSRNYKELFPFQSNYFLEIINFFFSIKKLL